MPMPHVDDSPEVCALKLRLWNVSRFIAGDIRGVDFDKSIDELKSIWRAWDALHEKESAHGLR